MGSIALGSYGRLASTIIAFAFIGSAAACGGGGSSPPPPPPANLPPIASAGSDQDVVEGALVSLSAAGSSDSDGSIVSYSWVQLSGPDIALENASSQVSSFVGPLTDETLTLEFEVTVTDDDGASSSDAVTVTVNPNQPPVVVAGGDDEVLEGQSYTLDASVSDADGTIVAITWQQISGPAVTLSDISVVNPTFVAPAVTATTDLQFELTATDSLGDVASDRVVISVRSNEPPEVTINFPCDGCRYYDSAITVSGTANAGADGGLDAVASLTVDAGSGAVNVAVRSDGGWLAQNVPVAASQNSVVINVTAEDTLGESTTATATLEYEPTITAAVITMDPITPGLLYLVETMNPLGRILSLDILNGAFEEIYEADELFRGLGQIVSVTPHPDGTSLLVTTFDNGIRAVNLDTGVVSTISDDSTGSGPSLSGLSNAALDDDDARLIATNLFTDEVVAVDIATGNRTIVSSNNGVGSGPGFFSPGPLAVDAANDIAYVRESGDNYLSVNLADGSRTELPRDGAVGSTVISALLFDGARSRIAAMDAAEDLVVVIDPSNGRRDVLSFSPADESLRTGGANEMVYDGLADRYVIGEFSQGLSSGADNDQVLSVDPVTGARSLLYKDTVGEGPSINGLVALAADLDAGFLYLGSESADTITRVDLRSGARAVLSSNTMGNGPQFGTIRGLYADSANDRLLLVDADSASLDAVDTATGDRTRLSGGLVGNGPAMSIPVAITFDALSDTAYVVDINLRSVFAVNTLTGERQVLSDDNSTGPQFTEPTGIALDLPNGRLLVTDNGTGETSTVVLFGVDISTGERTVVASLDTGTGTNFISLYDVEIIPDRDLAVAASGDALFILDLQTGGRTLLASSISGNGETIVNLQDIAFDPATNLVYGWSPNFEAVFVYSAETGDRVVLSK